MLIEVSAQSVEQLASVGLDRRPGRFAHADPGEQLHDAVSESVAALRIRASRRKFLPCAGFSFRK